MPFDSEKSCKYHVVLNMTKETEEYLSEIVRLNSFQEYKTESTQQCPWTNLNIYESI